MLQRLLFVVICVLFALTSKSQDASVRGFVYDSETGEPVIFTNVYLKGTGYGAATDVNGYYAISKVPPGDYELTVSFLGFDTLSEKISLKPLQVLTRKLYLEKSSVELNIFDVSAEKQEAQTEVKMSVVKITPKEINALPMVGGEADIAQYLQVLPGVVFTGDQGGQLYIRGGSPIQNKVLLDGMIVYNPFHTIGLFSVFDTDIMRNADIYTGGFNAEYGGRISSVMDITTRDGNKRRISGKIGANTFGAKALIEGPLKKEQEIGGSSSSFILSGKTSYLDQSSKLFYSYIDTAGLPFNFTDLYGKISFNGATGSKANIFGFNYRDRVNWRSISDLQWDAVGGGTNFVLLPEGSQVLVEGNVAYSSYKVSLEEANRNARSSSIEGFNAGIDFTYFNGDDELKYGFEVLGFSTDFDFFNSLDRQISQEASTTEIAGFVKYRWNYGNLVFDPSFRAHFYASLATFSPEPRLGIKYNLSEDIRLKFAAGVYSQNLISANSDRDVVNLFYGFLSGPENLQDTVYNVDGTSRLRTHELQKANHFIVGVEYDISKRLNLNVEGYLKQFTQLSNINRNKIFDDNVENINRPDLLKKDFIVETGDAMGLDFVLKYDYKQLYIWAVYSIGVVNRYDGIQEYHPIFDRRHNVNFVASLTFGEDLNWEASARWNLGSGFPFTQTQGYYEQLDFLDGINTDYTSENGDIGISYGDINNGRLPYYHRLDLTLKRKFYFGENSELETSVSVTNAYNRENIFYFDRVNFERVNQLPFMPSVGAYWKF
ncbi:MAG: TonB-dependent receptor [Flavobacteriales bacterium]|nr:TonB-dependent receptor [Flavobacteriales bacterium]